MAKPFIKWAGGKRQILSFLKQAVPRSFNRYWEPFLGGGALFFALRPEVAYLSDINEELVNTYIIVRDSVDELISVLKDYQRIHWQKEDEGREKEFYDRVRRLDPEKLKPAERAARFIYLNRTCWNGLWRVDRNGRFNVPIGRYRRPKICDEKTLLSASRALRNAKIFCEDFEEALCNANSGDFVYLDPPYYFEDGNGFTQYSKDNFSFEDHKRLAKVFRELDQRGCYVLLSNSNAEKIKELYEGYNIITIKASRFLNSDASNRKNAATEILVSNYPLKLTLQKNLFETSCFSQKLC